MLLRPAVIVVFLAFALPLAAQTSSFVTVKRHQLNLAGKPYYFVGTNYWYGALLGKEKKARLSKELDFLKANGVTNLRLMAGAEGEGPMNGVTRVGPPLHLENSISLGALAGLDFVLAEMGKRKMKAVIFLSNNWEWSGGFQQYLIWHKVIPDRWLTTKPTWDELRDNVAKFYSCTPCMDDYALRARSVINRMNLVTRQKYVDDPTIMAWELANEPRPMRPAANDDYKAWIADTAAMIKELDSKHLVTIGHEGRIGTESLEIFEEIHADPNIDYLTIHIWPKNWAWFAPEKMAEEYSKAEAMTGAYIMQHAVVAAKLKKPLVIEEFGLPRDAYSFDPASPTLLRDRYYSKVLSYVKTTPNIAGANFWAFGGAARPIKGQLFWKPGDEYMGDPPMEEQGLYTVFDRDRSTWRVIGSAARRVSRGGR
ncbi:MAG: cellulase family glycosylhydrolase [Pyrinomonadaceae bacterium]